MLAKQNFGKQTWQTLFLDTDYTLIAIIFQYVPI